MKLSPEDLEKKRKLDNLRRVIADIKVKFSVKKIKTWDDFYSALDSKGIPRPSYSDGSLEFNFQSLKKQLDRIQDEFEKSLQQQTIQVEHGSSNVSASNTRLHDTDSKATESKSENNESAEQTQTNYGLSESPLEKATLMWFQKKAAKELLDGILQYHRPAQYLIGGAGSGKTYVLGAMLRRLIDDNWHKKDTISPWPIIYVTKASVVTQTKRVLKDDFCIPGEAVTCIAIDQLRAKFGELFVHEQVEHISGEEVVTYTWRPMIWPKLIIIDEGHSVKNHTSIQHKIILSYANLPNSNIIFSSATPYTRVSEGKVFVIASKIKHEIL